MTRLILFNKPYQVLCQFTDSQSGGQPRRGSLADFISVADVYAAGRLDYDSEGLVLLTDSGRLQHTIADPQYKLPKVYWVQVEGVPDEAVIRQFSQGISLRDGLTRSAGINKIVEPQIWPRTPPIRERRSIPTSWVEITLFEGRKRQIRRMLAAVGYPVLRLIRQAIGPWQLANLQPGQWMDGDPGKIHFYPD